MRQIFDDEDTEGGLLVDASNTFNSMIREAALWNCRILWPSCSRFLFNTYRDYARIFMKGSKEILLSKEGTTQGDPLVMIMHGVGMLPLTRELLEVLIKAIQILYADDSGCVLERWKN